MTELKSCPFCGGIPTIEYVEHTQDRLFQIVCSRKCEGRNKVMSNRHELTGAWNRRFEILNVKKGPK